MRFARVQVSEQAAPVLAMACDGALYDVGVLEERWGARAEGVDFHARVVAARGAGLDGLQARLLAGRRPTEARLREGEYLPLPPCDPARASYVQLGPSMTDAVEPQLRLRDARALVGDAQPVAVKEGELHAELGLAVLLAEDLDGATPSEARRAILGFSLAIDWTLGDAWGSASPQPGTQLGPHLVVSPRWDAVLGLAVRWESEERSGVTERVGMRTFAVEEAVAFASHHVSLRAGDVVGLGCLVGGRLPARIGARLRIELPGVMALTGWTVSAPPAPEWRLPRP